MLGNKNGTKDMENVLSGLSLLCDVNGMVLVKSGIFPKITLR